ncbi:hypothetical protein WDV93_15075 [Pantoea ananatis]
MHPWIIFKRGGESRWHVGMKSLAGGVGDGRRDHRCLTATAVRQTAAVGRASWPGCAKADPAD